MILITSIMDLMGMDLLPEIWKKLEINKRRTWGPPDEHGVQQHVAEPTEEP